MILCPLQNGGVLSDKIWIQRRPHVTQHFGENPDIYKQFGLRAHNGTDFRAAVGTPLFSPIEGVVHEIGDQGNKGYGKFIRLRKDNVEIVMAHLSSILVKEEDRVYLGDRIGLTGNTGFSTGAHLHFGQDWGDQENHANVLLIGHFDIHQNGQNQYLRV